MPVKLTCDDLDRRAVYTFHHLHLSITKLEDKMHRKFGITTKKFIVLSTIKSIIRQVTPTVIAEWLDRNTNSITLIIDRMEKDDLVSRVRDLNDRRSLRIKIEEKGEEVFRRVVVHNHALYKEIMSCLNKHELQELIRLMDKVLEKTFEMRQLRETTKEVRIK